jgi:hypothetical protein
MRLTGRWLSVGMVALLLLGMGITATAQERAQPRRPPIVHGRLESKSDSGFTLSTRQGEASVRIDADSQFHVPGEPESSLDDLHIGDHVLVLGRRADTGRLVARQVTVLPPIPLGTLKGEVTLIEGDVLSVSTPQGENLLLTDENTQFRVPDVEDAGLSDIEVGARVFALVERRDDTLLARVVTVLPEGAPGPIGLRGRVTQIDAPSLAVRVHEQHITVVTTEATHFRVPTVENANLADIRVGDWVLIVGRLGGLCQVEARDVGVLPQMPAHRFLIPGEVLAIEETTLTVQDPKDTHLVHTDDKTRFIEPGVENATIADIEVGDHILALGQPAEGRNLLARWIWVLPPPSGTAERSGEVAPSERLPAEA